MTPRSVAATLVLITITFAHGAEKAITEKQAVAIARAEVTKREGWRNTEARGKFMDGQWVVLVHQDFNTPGIYRMVIVSSEGKIVKYEAGR